MPREDPVARVTGPPHHSRLDYPLTDCGNAERLVDQHGEAIRYCSELRRWFIWNGCRWTSNAGEVVQLAKKTVRAMRHERTRIMVEAERYPDEWQGLRRRADTLTRWQQRSEASGSIAAMVRLAESDPRVSITSQAFDQDPWVLNLQNGTVDLREGRVREHRPQELITKLAGAEYESKAQCPGWKIFLGQVFGPHPELIPFLQKAIGYTLTGSTREECVFILVGRGRNGKSTMISVLDRLLGDYAGIAEMETFLTSRGSHPREDIADMKGRRMISAQEPRISGAFAESTLKWVSGGDRLRARRLYEHALEFQPSHKLWLGVNHLPALARKHDAVWSRLRVIPFDVSFENQPNRELKSQLLCELNGILRWAIRGCIEWQRHGLESPACVTAATERLRIGGNVAA